MLHRATDSASWVWSVMNGGAGGEGRRKYANWMLPAWQNYFGFAAASKAVSITAG